jgi:2-oxoglutarate ferredoxin oxidoreductase subunit delta
MKARLQTIMGKKTGPSKESENSPNEKTPPEGLAVPSAEKRPKEKKKEFRIDIYRAWCKACGICIAFCPAQVFTRGEEGYPQVSHPEACTGCGWCEIRCPDFAITVQEKTAKRKKD